MEAETVVHAAANARVQQRSGDIVNIVPVRAVTVSGAYAFLTRSYMMSSEE
jgi:hypothetical protein